MTSDHQQPSNTKDPHAHRPEIVFFIDKQRFVTDQPAQTPTSLLQFFAGEDPKLTTLVRKDGHELHKYTDPNEPITLHEGDAVRRLPQLPDARLMKFGAERLSDDLIVLGYTVERVGDPQNNPFVIVRDYTIELGRFAGRAIDLGLPAPPNFPQGVGSAIHVRSLPHLFETTDTVPNVRNITASPLGAEWRYWSRNFGWTEERSTRRLMSQINEIFLHA